MFIVYVILAVLLASALWGSASLKLRRDVRAVQGIHEVVGVPLSWFPFLACCEIAGGVGLVIGTVWAPVGIAAGVGVAVYMLGAMAAHLRVRDFRGVGSPTILLAVAVATILTRVASL